MWCMSQHECDPAAAVLSLESSDGSSLSAAVTWPWPCSDRCVVWYYRANKVVPQGAHQ